MTAVTANCVAGHSTASATSSTLYVRHNPGCSAQTGDIWMKTTRRALVVAVVFSSIFGAAPREQET